MVNTGTIKCVIRRVVSTAVMQLGSFCDAKGRRTVFGVGHMIHLHGIAAQYSLILACYKKKNVQNLIISTKEGFKKINLQTLK
jgi:hypothetical protein